MLKRPNITLLRQGNDDNAHIATCARICYASTCKSVEKDAQLVERLKNNKHLSVFRHLGVYLIVPMNDTNEKLSLNPNCIKYADVVFDKEKIYIATNMQCYLECLTSLEQYRIDYIQAINEPIFVNNGLIRYTFIVETGIDVSRELNRVSPNAISEQSTRYVDFTKKLGLTFKECHWMRSMNWWKKLLVKFMCAVDSWFYRISRSHYGLDLQPEDARWCLFLDIKTKVVYTYSVNEWAHIIDLRYFGTTGLPHPDAKMVVNMIKNCLNDEGYCITPNRQ